MEIGNKNIIKDLCLNFGLGKVIGEPIEVQGGLLHTMFQVTTELGVYAIKCLNPAIMNRKCALNNIINSEKISETLGLYIPTINAKKINNKHVHQYKTHYFMFFDWVDGNSVYLPEITEEHCKAIGHILGKIHSLNISVIEVEDEIGNSQLYNWNDYLERAKTKQSTWVSIFEESLEQIILWNQLVVNAKALLSKEKVISHRDLDPKNVMWKGNSPYIIDWEAAGYVNPYQELLEVLNYWADDGRGSLHKKLLRSILKSYTTHKSISNVDWDVILDSGYEGMLGWLEYNVKRALGIEISNDSEILLGEQQVIGTIVELKRYQDKICFLKEQLVRKRKEQYMIT